MAVAVATVLVALAAVTFVYLRLTLLLPAIAVDAPGASLANAFADTEGHIFGMLFIFVLAMLPPIVLITTLSLLLWSPRSVAGGGTSLGSLSFAVVLTMFQVVIYAMLAAISSRIFQALAQRVLRAPVGS